jgi:hypothetical protein
MGSPSSSPFFFVYALQWILSFGFITKKEKQSSYQLGFSFTLTTWYEKTRKEGILQELSSRS